MKATKMELSLIEIWASMGLLAKAVAIGLVAMGLASWVVALERALVLRRAWSTNARFVDKARPFMLERDLEALEELANTTSFARTPLARLVRQGLGTFGGHRRNGRADPVTLTRRELARLLEALSADARRGMGILATTGSTAPFIGLFGTVIGIITAFQGIAAAGGGGLGAVSAGIAEALIVTAVGLFVAIAAVLAFNYLSARFDRFDMSMQHSAGELLDQLGGDDA
jgi:biopolymer transport protein ExbB/TolQ